MSRPQKYNYNPSTSPVYPHRPKSQAQNRASESARAHYDPFFNAPGQANLVPKGDLSHIKISDILNQKRNRNYENLGNLNNVNNSLLPNSYDPNLAVKSNSVKNINNSGDFLQNAIQMDEFLKLREELQKLRDENHSFRIEREEKDKEIFTLNEQLISLQAENQNIKNTHKEEIHKKDKLITKLKRENKQKEELSK